MKNAEHSNASAAPAPALSGVSIYTPVALALLALAIALVFANGINGAFVSDDVFAISRNPSLQTLAGAFTPNATGRGVTSDGRPLVNFSLAVNYALGGLNPAGYHVFNIFFHTLAAWALFGLARKTLSSEKFAPTVRARAGWLSLAISLLWAVHPLQTNAVTYIVQRAEELGALFYLLTLYCLARSKEEKSWRGWLPLGVASAFFGVACKETVATLPFATLLYDRVFLGGTWREALKKRWKFHLAIASSWIMLAWFYTASGARANTVGFAVKHTPWEYLQTQGWAIAHYLKLAFWPSDLVLDYGTMIVTGLARAGLPGLLTLSLALLTLYGLKRHPVAAFPGALFFLYLAPTSSFVPALTTVCEYRMYLPLAALVSFVIVGGWTIAGEKLSAKLPALPLALLTLVFCALAWTTVERNTLYRDEAVIFEDVQAKLPENYRAALYLAQIYMERGRYAEAAELFRRHEHIDPTDARLKAALGMALIAQGLALEAVEPLSRAAVLSPDDPPITVALTTALLMLNRPGEALNLLDRAASRNPRDAGLALNRGAALMALGRPSDAADAYRRGLTGGAADPATRQELINALKEAEGFQR